MPSLNTEAGKTFNPDLGGRLRVIITADPAAGAETTVTVTAGKVWEILSATVSLVQGATQTPLPSLSVTDGTTTLGVFPGTTTVQAVSTTTQYHWAPGMSLSGQVGGTTFVRSTGAIPPNFFVPAGGVISTITQGPGANTNYGPMAILVREFDGV